MSRPSLIIIAGPNGAGKSTAASNFLRGALKVHEFVNADEIARGLSGFAPESVAISAGRVMIHRLREIASKQANFAFETTLASRSFAPWIKELSQSGYQFTLLYFWLASEELALSRVRSRVKLGGHAVPEETIRRRYHAGLQNFFELYQPLANSWRVYDNSSSTGPNWVASGKKLEILRVHDPNTWLNIRSAPR